VDVYALGAILYELLTGRPPFKAASVMDTMMLVLYEEPVPPARLQPGVPRDLDTIVLKCLQKEPRKRYAAALDLADDLRRYLDNKPITARPVRWWERALKWARRRPAAAALLAVSALALAAGMIGTVAFTARLSEERKEALRQQGIAQEKERQALEALEDSRQAQVGLHLANGNRRVDVGDLTSLVASLPSFAEAFRLDNEDPVRAELYRLRLGMTLQRCPRLLGVWQADHEVVDVAFSPDGQSFATAGRDGTVRIRNLAADRVIVLRHAGAVLRVLFSPDGRRVLTATDGGAARVWDPATGEPVTNPLVHAAPVVDAAFCPDGRSMVTAAGSLVRVWDAASGRELVPPLKHEGDV
jgi:hypothetical protein